MNVRQVLFGAAVATLAIGSLIGAAMALRPHAVTHLAVNVAAKRTGYAPGPKPPAFYANRTSLASFDQIAASVSSIRDAGAQHQAPIKAYVFFDPACPHCAKLVQNALSPDGITVYGDIAWVPVGFLTQYSTLQGATLLGAENPDVALMEHATRVLKGQPFALNVKRASQADIDKVVANTKVWQSAGIAEVPLIVTKDASGKTLVVAGELEGFELAEFLSGKAR